MQRGYACFFVTPQLFTLYPGRHAFVILNTGPYALFENGTCAVSYSPHPVFLLAVLTLYPLF